MATWEEIRDEVAGMLADGDPLEDIIAKLEKQKNEMAKAKLLKAMDDMKKREQTNEEWLRQANKEDMEHALTMLIMKDRFFADKEFAYVNTRFKVHCWLKEKHE